MRPPADPRRPTTDRPVDESMSLLNQILNNPLDSGYLQAAARDHDQPRRRSVWGTALIVALAIGLGIITVWGARALRLPAAADTRQALEREAEDRSEQVDDQRRQVESLQSQLGALRDARLPALVSNPSVEVAAATTTVVGPGLSVTLDDAPAAKKDPEANPELLVRDTDVQEVVNGLWQSDAEAIAVNGHRLTSQSTIRTAGSAIQVDLISLLPPYRIEAIGDPDSLQRNLARTAAQNRITLLQSTYGMPVQVRTEKELELPAAAITGVRYATPAAPAGIGGPTDGARSGR